jgi:hypothetical protein
LAGDEVLSFGLESFAEELLSPDAEDDDEDDSLGALVSFFTSLAVAAFRLSVR